MKYLRFATKYGLENLSLLRRLNSFVLINSQINRRVVEEEEEGGGEWGLEGPGNGGLILLGGGEKRRTPNRIRVEYRA